MAGSSQGYWMNSSSTMFWLLLPCAISRNTSTSRWLRPSGYTTLPPFVESSPSFPYEEKPKRHCPVVELSTVSSATYLRPSSEDPAGTGARVLAVVDDGLAVDEHVRHAGCKLVRLLESRAIDNGRRVEDRKVGDKSLL